MILIPHPMLTHVGCFVNWLNMKRTIEWFDKFSR